MPDEDRPAWLPEGWTMVVKTRLNRGSKDRYYTCPLTGYTFRSKVEVMRHLSTAKDDGHAPELASHEEANKQASDKEDKKQALHEKDNQQQLAVQVVNSLEWLPSGWILENKIRTKGASPGKKYKCYVDPFTGTRFYSKGQVIRYLEAHKHGSSSYAQRTRKNRAANNSSDHVRSPSDQKRSMKVNLANNNCASTNNRKSINTKSINNVRSTFEYSPNGLPHGWIKEVRITKNKGTIRKDPYYIDPVRGYVFRSKRGVFRYIETGEISKNASRQNKRHVSEVYSSNKESNPLAANRRRKVAARRLFSQPQPLNERMPVEIADVPMLPSSPQRGRTSEQSDEECSGTSCLTPVDAEHMAKGSGNFQIVSCSVPALVMEGIPGQKVEFGRVGALEPASEELPEPVSETPSKPVDQLEDEKLPVRDAKLLEEGQSELAEEQQHQPKKRGRGRPPKKRGRGRPPGSRKTNAKLSEEGQAELAEEQQHQPKKQGRGRQPGWGKNKATKPVNSGIGPRKPRASKAITMPVRASKRLAGVEAAPVANSGIGDRSLRENVKQHSARSHRSFPIPEDKTAVLDFDPPENPGSKDSYVEHAVKREQVDPLMLPFEASWVDPCIEFAFKTLTGDIPVLEDTAAIQDYFEQQLFSTTSSRGPAPLTSEGLVSAQVQPLDKGCLPSFRDEGGMHSLENVKANNECHQKTRLNH